MTISNKDLISTTLRVTHSYRPDLLEMFKYGKRNLGLKCHIDFRIGEFWDSYGRAVFKTSNNPHTVLIPNHTLELLNHDELLYLIGHELGHIAHQEDKQTKWDESVSRILPEPDKLLPEIRQMVYDTFAEICAN